MSNLEKQPGTNLFRHELTHVWQNRAFGPLFALSYLAWLVIWVLPGMVAGAIVRAGVFQGIEKWTYFNNPWEVWGYAVQQQDRKAFGHNDQERRLIWSSPSVVLWSLPFFGLILSLAGLVIWKTWVP